MPGTYRPPNPNNALPQIEKDFAKAVLSWDAATVKIILSESPALVDKKNSVGKTALMTAAMYGDTSMTRWLLKNGATPDAQDDDGRTALIWAARHGMKFTVDKLLDNGADINKTDNRGRTALMGASVNGHDATVHTLLQRGADMYVQDHFEATALSEAHRNRKLGAMKILEKWDKLKKQEQIEAQKKKYEQWLEDTDHSKGLKNPIRAPRPLKALPKKGL